MMHPPGARLAAAMVVAAAVLAGCSPEPGEQTREPKPPATTADTTPVPGLEGRFFTAAGERSLDADLYELSFSPLRLRRLTKGQRVTTIGACPSALVVSAAQREVGFADTIQEYRGGAFGALDGLGKPPGSLPALAEDCRVAYLDVDREAPTSSVRLRVWDPGKRAGSVLDTAPGLGGFDWGPAGEIAAVERTATGPDMPGTATAIVIFGPDGARRPIPPPAPSLGSLHWALSGWMAIDKLTEGTIFLNPGTGQQAELAGWYPKAWSPDGKRLLVGDVATERTLGLVELSDLTTVRTIGRAATGVFDTVWLPPDATAVAPATG